MSAPSRPLKLRIRNWLRLQVGPALVYWLYSALRRTWRLSYDECPSFRDALAAHRSVLLAHWHGDELALMQQLVPYRCATLVSNSRDGELMDGVLRLLKVPTARGSSSKGGAAGLRALVQLCRKGGYNVSFAVDGPKGPIYKAKPGIFEFSRLMDAPVYAVSVGVGNPWISQRSWNRAVLPKPFSRVHVRIVEALPPVSRDIDPRDPQLALQLETLLNEGRKVASAAVGAERA